MSQTSARSLGPLLLTREWFDHIDMYAGVGTCRQDVQFRTPSVLHLAPAEDTVSQVDQVLLLAAWAQVPPVSVSVSVCVLKWNYCNNRLILPV